MSLSSDNEFVRTVRGDIPAAKIGFTQCHEHIFLKKGPSFELNPALCMDDPLKSRMELESYAQAGGSTILDAQPGGFGRDGAVLNTLSKESLVNIVAVTGFHKKCFMEPEANLDAFSAAELERRFTGEIMTGMRDERNMLLSARAGIVKAAFEPGAFEDELYRKLFAAAAGTAAGTGASVMVHTEKNTDILRLIGYFADYGIRPEKIIICHLDRTRYDPEYHKKVLSCGCFLCYDSIHRYKYVSEEDERRLIREMIDSGYAGQLLFSLDTTNERLRAYHAKDMGLDYILKTFIPALTADGIAKETIDRICRINPGQALKIGG